MSERHPKLLLEDILECAEKIILYTTSLSFEEFTSDSKTVDAVLRNFGIIGEATNRLPEDFKDNSPDIDWFRIRGFRNRIIHDYFGIKYEMLWSIKEEQLPPLIEKIKHMLSHL